MTVADHVKRFEVEDEPATAVLRRMAAELDAVATGLANSQNAIGGCLNDRQMRTGTSAELQNLDHLTQRVAGLAAFAAAIADLAAPSYRLSASVAAQALTLSAQADFLAGRSGVTDETDAGDLILF